MDAIIGTAGWSVAAREAEHFPAEGSALERYAAVFAGTEINSSFHRSHRAATWERWAASVPSGFRFSAKIPKTVTHQKKLVDCADLVTAFLEEVKPLGPKLELLLVQLPPSLGFDTRVAAAFFTLLRGLSDAAIACEPRHPSWFEQGAERLLEKLEVARVARLAVAELHERWERDRAALQVLDVRERAEWDAGHIPGAVHTPYHDLHEMPGELDPSRPIAVICASGQRAAVAASVLKALGARDVIHVVEGGVPLWRRQGWPID